MKRIEKTFLKFKTDFFQKYWTDLVWSKVIAAGIIAIISSVLTAAYILIKSLYDKVSLKYVSNQISDYLNQTTEVNNFILLLSILILAYVFCLYLKDIINKIKKKTIAVKNIKKPNELPVITEHSTVLFSYRLANAFPGQRGLLWYDAKTAVKRFKILFQEPLRFKSGGHYGCIADPIWWFRDSSALPIDRFKILSKTKVLIGIEELEINRVAVYTSNSYYKCFVYIETKGEKQTGLYNLKTDYIQRNIDFFGYCSEEFGLLGKKYIRREEFDDGATVIKDKVVDATTADLRRRYLTDYNLIIAAKQSPYNSKKFSMESNDYFNNILQKKQTAESFFEFLETLEKGEE